VKRPARGIVYGLLGWCIEVVFTAVQAQAQGKGDRRLEGQSYLWMPPIYAAGGFACEAIAAGARRRPWWQRGLLYAVALFGIEYASGAALRRTVGECPWDYADYKLNVNGLIRLDYLPAWAIAGLALERVTPVLKRVELRA
jgi:uncharacterized membrane protein